MSRTILHIDMNNFYASVECLYNPELRGKPVVVGGDEEARHGIVLAKNYIAKAYGIQTGNALWEARNACPELVVVRPSFQRYIMFSQIAKEIYGEYTDQVESFGLDECWLDVTASKSLFGSGESLANEIRERIKTELGITASVGVSFNKIFSKLGSDMKKPDATTVITKENFREIAWSLPVGELLYVGRKTEKKLRMWSIKTIGDLANCDVELLKNSLGKIGVMLWYFANGMDSMPVANVSEKAFIKSVGNSTTTPRDLITDEDIKITLYLLSESVAARLREYGFVCSTVQVTIREKSLLSFNRQQKLNAACADSNEIFKAAYELVKKHKTLEPIRSLGVRACNLRMNQFTQMSFDPYIEKMQRHEAAEEVLDEIRNRFGNKIIQRGIMFTDRKLSAVNPKDDHLIHPVALLK